ncbi:Lipopolysaccharide biosynthesis protein WzxC [Rubripirellula lacrimiformis]|uniref:Lipopolysaccharide biosynthesis protein WzxC n=2 Tax=Rubripirellula lacrimiformis TaxID=1930273 RepID=A0A517NFH0_9BACT|nr:Lipopolysaccharide biosynthesis protein WzxC [Rubripirellula lacrimiformis]
MDYFSDDAVRSQLRTKTVRGAAITGITQIIRIGIGLATIPLLARLLQPEDFGLFAIVAVITNFALIFVDAGLSMATIQRESINRTQVSNLFWTTAAIGLALTAIVSATGPVLGWLYAEPRLAWLVAVTALTYIFAGLTIQHQALLRRCMLFNRIAVIEVLSLLAGQVAAIVWAFNHTGQANDYWALALIPLVSSGTRMLGVWSACRWIPQWPARDPQSRQMLHFGGNLTVGQACNYLSSNVDQLAVGYVFGDASLGNYERSTTLALQPIRQINGPLTSVCVPALSRLIDQPEKYFHAFRTAVVLVGLLIVPFASLCIVEADKLVPLIMGPGWNDAINIFRLLAVSLLTLPICNASAWLLISQGRGAETLKVQAVDAVLKIGLVGCGIPFGVLGVAAATPIRSLVMPAYLFGVIGRSGPVRSRAIWKLCLVQMLAVATTTTMLLAIRWCSVNSEPSAIVVSALAAGLTSTAIFLAFRFVRTGIADIVRSLPLAHATAS